MKTLIEKYEARGLELKIDEEKITAVCHRPTKRARLGYKTEFAYRYGSVARMIAHVEQFLVDLDRADQRKEERKIARAAAKAAAEAAKAKAKKPKKKVVAMSLVMLEVKPLDDTIDLDALAQKIFNEITQDGLCWKTEYKKEPIAYGVNKLVIGATIQDDLCSTDELQEKIEALEDYVQSVDIAAFNKL